jgi:hypothetical protein
MFQLCFSLWVVSEICNLKANHIGKNRIVDNVGIILVPIVIHLKKKNDYEQIIIWFNF